MRWACILEAVLQITRRKRKNLRIISGSFFFSMKKYVLTPSLEPSCQDGSNEGSKHKSSLRLKFIAIHCNKKKISLNYPQYRFLSGYLDIWIEVGHLLKQIRQSREKSENHHFSVQNIQNS